MAKIQGQIENAQLENKTSDYSAGVAGRVWWNTTDLKVKSDDGTNIRAHLRNDGLIIIGNNGTAANNVRLHRGANGVLQFVLASDSTAEGSLSTALAQLSSKIENYTNGTRPAAGNAGRVIFNSTTGSLQLDNGVDWEEVGSGGQGGVNYLTLDTAFLVNKPDNANAEQSVGDWVTYADSAGVSPVDMTGGSATQLTLSRTTTTAEILNGAASFKVVKAAANAQGQGVSCVANVPIGYRGQTASIVMPFKLYSGTLVQGDLKVFAYDVTNSLVLTPFNNDVVAQSRIQATVDIPSSCAQIRFGFHFAATTTTAATILFDDVVIGPREIVYTAPMTNWESGLTFTPNSFGTTTGNVFKYRRIGDTVEVSGYFITGTTTAAIASITLPSTLVIDSSKTGTGTNAQVLGTWYGSLITASYGTSNLVGSITFDGSTSGTVFLTYNSSTSGEMSKFNANILTSGTGVHFFFRYPVAGWSSNVTATNSQVFRISNVIANGTAVSTTPATLGEYRCYWKNAGVVTVTTSLGAGFAPSASNGMQIRGNVANGGTGASTDPELWQIFVGKNKQIKFEWYNTTGKTGEASPDITTPASSSVYGTATSYDPTTGIATIDAAFTFGGGSTTTDRKAGILPGTSFNTSNNLYFDIVVSENTLAVTVPDDRVFFHYNECSTSASTGVITTLLYPTKVVDTHNAYNTSTGNFTCPRKGLYRFSMSHASAALTPAADNREKDVIFEVNGVAKREYIEIFGSTTNHTYFAHGTFECQLEVGDTVRVRLSQNSGSTWTGSSGTTGSWFTGMQVG